MAVPRCVVLTNHSTGQVVYYISYREQWEVSCACVPISWGGNYMCVHNNSTFLSWRELYNNNGFERKIQHQKSMLVNFIIFNIYFLWFYLNLETVWFIYNLFLRTKLLIILLIYLDIGIMGIILYKYWCKIVRKVHKRTQDITT